MWIWPAFCQRGTETSDRKMSAAIDLENWFAKLPSSIESFTPSGIIDTAALNTENLISGVVGSDDSIEPHT